MVLRKPEIFAFDKKYKILQKLFLLIIVVQILKFIFHQPRPKGAKYCDYLNLIDCSDDFGGMPSSHAATTVALLKLSGYSNLVAIVGGALMGWSRVYKKCHTPAQSLAGGFIGWIFATLF